MNQKEKKEKIMFAAMALFSKKGFAGTSMKDIAIKAGIGKGTTYEYFKGKDQLFFATFEWFIEYSENIAKKSISSNEAASCEEKLRLFSQSVLDALKDSEEFYPLILEFWAASASSKYRDKIKEIFKMFYQKIGRILISIINQGIENKEFYDQIDVDSIVPGIAGAWDAIGLQAWFYYEDNNGFDIAKTMTGFTDLIIRGLKNKQKT